MTITQLEKRIVWISLVFVLLLFGFAALAINTFHVGLPTCLTTVKPFQKGELITHSPTHYELHYVARMWRFEPQEVTVPTGSTVDIYLSTADVTHGLILLGTDLNLMAVPGVVNYTRVKFDKPRVYQLLCQEYCGTGHDRMAANLRVVDAASFHPQAGAPEPRIPADPRYKLLEAKECMSCHSMTAEADLAPSFKGPLRADEEDGRRLGHNSRRCLSARIHRPSQREDCRRLRRPDARAGPHREGSR